MSFLNRFTPVLAASMMALPMVAFAQAPGSSVTAGFLDYRSATANGNPTVPPNGYHAGPYTAGFSTTSLVNAQNTALAANFNVFCIDLLGGAGDGAVKLLTFAQAINDADLIARYSTASQGKFEGLSPLSAKSAFQTDLTEAAYLSTKFTVSNVSDWDEIHVALWSLFWKPGTNGLPNYAT